MSYSLNALNANRNTFHRTRTQRENKRMSAPGRRSLIWVGAIASIAGMMIALYASNTFVQAGQKPTVITVHGGDTVWSIATRLGHGLKDPRALEYQIIEVNHLNDAGLVLTPGEKLIVP